MLGVREQQSTMRMSAWGLFLLIACACAHQRTPSCPTGVVLPRSFDIGPASLVLDSRLDTSAVPTTDARTRHANPHLRFRRILEPLAIDIDSVIVGLDDSMRVKSIHVQFSPQISYEDLV